MKMRFWQKTYVFTLVLFLLCLNAGVLSLTVYTYRKNVQAVETAVTAEQHYIAMCFERDYTDLTEDSPDASVSLLMQSFCTHYGDKGVLLAFQKDGNEFCTTFPLPYDIDPNTLMHVELGGKRHILISAEICGGAYDMLFAKNVESLDKEFRSLMLTYALTAAGVSAILAIGLYFVLKRLSVPLFKLQKTTEAIEAGDFSVKAEEVGNDEFTALARSFNAMLGTIDEQMHALEQEASRKQMLVDNMAHELRTPLTSIRGYAEFLQKASTTEEKRIISAGYILSESKRLQKISELLLDSAHIRSHAPETETLDLAHVLTDAAEKLRLKADACGVSLVCDVVSAEIRGNETLLSMLFYNLAENAIKACSAGGKVVLRCEENRASVTDNGKGMTEEQLSHVCEPFYRTDKSRSRAEGGAGLGLSLCKQIADAHGASLSFVSEPEKGTTVTVEFEKRRGNA